MKPKEISFALRTSIGNHSRIMYILKDLVRKRAKLSTARNISKNTTIIIPSHNIPSFKPAKTFISEVKHQVK